MFKEWGEMESGVRWKIVTRDGSKSVDGRCQGLECMGENEG